jgi:hypothetical protein
LIFIAVVSTVRIALSLCPIAVGTVRVAVGVSYVIESLMKITAKGRKALPHFFTLHTSLHSHSVAVTTDQSSKRRLWTVDKAEALLQKI